MNTCLRFALLLFCGLAGCALQAAELHVAVASNFAAPFEALRDEFERNSEHRLLVSLGSTGQLYAQIRHGAPFDVLLAADTATPAELTHNGQGVPGSGLTYAIGRLVLWSREPHLVDSEAALLSPSLSRLALANPRLAPYGAAALQTLQSLGLSEVLSPTFIQGQNISQAYQFVATGNAPMGFVALSQVIDPAAHASDKLPTLAEGSGWIVPTPLHEPIRQDAIVLTHGADHPATPAFMRYLQSPAARDIIAAYGYDF